MNGEWPVLLDIMGKGEGEERYLSVAEVRTLFVERRLPDRIVARLQRSRRPRREVLSHGRQGRARGRSHSLLSLLVAIVEFPDQAGSILPQLVAQFLPPPLPTVAPVKEAHWLDQNWSTEDRHWFHHASQGTATFPVPYDWFVALEQPGLHLFTRPGLIKDSDYLERFGFLPSPKTVHTDEATLRRFGYSTCVRRQDRAGAGVGRGPASRRRPRISTACRSASRGWPAPSIPAPASANPTRSG